jgi:hypothetical protein
MRHTSILKKLALTSPTSGGRSVGRLKYELKFGKSAVEADLIRQYPVVYPERLRKNKENAQAIG